ncbi:MAG TPA: hypothetical protein VGN17_17465 [Bryobacteraceae bacterium]|jgi:hypothetical protein
MRVLHVFPETMAEGSAEEKYARELTDGMRELRVKVEMLRANRASLAVRAKLWAAVGRNEVVLAGFLTEAMTGLVRRMAKARGAAMVVLGEDVVVGEAVERVRNVYEARGARCAIPQGRK